MSKPLLTVYFNSIFTTEGLQLRNIVLLIDKFQQLQFIQAERLQVGLNPPHRLRRHDLLKHRPPLGFFRNFVLIHGGEHHNTLDLKHRGIVPIIDIARVAALSAGIREINTLERLRAAGRVNALSRDGSANLEDAFEFIGTLRVQHQVRQMRAGEATDNYLKPEELSSLERRHLKDAFGIIDTVQVEAPPGIYHATPSGQTTWHGLAQAAVAEECLHLLRSVAFERRQLELAQPRQHVRLEPECLGDGRRVVE